MQAIFDMYAGTSGDGHGVVHMADAIGLKDIHYPRRKINVMIIGNVHFLMHTAQLVLS